MGLYLGATILSTGGGGGGIGKTITVQYFEETLNQDGCHSLRFPVVKHVYDGVRTI